MLDAHVEAGFMVGVPFGHKGLYDFGSHGGERGWRVWCVRGRPLHRLVDVLTRAAGITRRVTELGSVMLKHRLTPPPPESYSLHRKLSGAFLACIKLRARVPCHDLFYEVYEQQEAVQRGRDTGVAGEGGGEPEPHVRAAAA